MDRQERIDKVRDAFMKWTKSPFGGWCDDLAAALVDALSPDDPPAPAIGDRVTVHGSLVGFDRAPDGPTYTVQPEPTVASPPGPDFGKETLLRVQANWRLFAAGIATAMKVDPQYFEQMVEGQSGDSTEAFDAGRRLIESFGIKFGAAAEPSGMRSDAPPPHLRGNDEPFEEGGAGPGPAPRYKTGEEVCDGDRVRNPETGEEFDVHRVENGEFVDFNGARIDFGFVELVSRAEPAPADPACGTGDDLVCASCGEPAGSDCCNYSTQGPIPREEWDRRRADPACGTGTFLADALAAARCAAGPWIEGPPKEPKHGDVILADIGSTYMIVLKLGNARDGGKTWMDANQSVFFTRILRHARINPPAKEVKS